jgi:hypothetical protein
MGYDMYVVGEVHEADSDYDALFPDEPGYYRLNHTGMQAMFQIMLRAGILDTEASHGEWPDWPPEGMEVYRADELVEHYLVDIDIMPPPTPEESEKTRLYLARRAEIQATQSPRPGLVPAFKFRSNNQWHVTSPECRIIADGLRRALESDRTSILPHPEESGLSYDRAEKYVLQWASFNDFAARHGGYRVH